VTRHWRIRPSDFGDYIQVDMPEGTDMLLVCVDTEQHTPVRICLPHQLYVDKAREILRQHGAKTLTVMPYRNDQKIEIELPPEPLGDRSHLRRPPNERR